MRNICHQLLKEINNQKTFLRRCLHTTISGWTMFWIAYGMTLGVIHADANSPIAFFRHGYKFKNYFICIWATFIQYIYFSMYSMIDFLEVYNQNKNLAKLTNILHKAASFLMFSIIFPIAILILVFFWGIYWWDRETIYPSCIEEYFPWWLNHSMHTFPVPLSIIYMFTSTKSEPSKLTSCSGLVIFLSIYGYLLFSLKESEGQWVYIFMELMTTFQNQVVYTLITFSALGLVFLGHKLYNYFRVLQGKLTIT